MDLTTKAVVKERYLSGISGTGKDSIIDGMITAVSKKIEQFIDRFVEEKQRTQFFDVIPGQHRVLVKGFPIVSVAEVNNDAARNFGSTDIINADSFAINKEIGEINVDLQTLVEGGQVLKVVYTGGMGTDQADFEVNFPDIADAAAKQVGFEYQRRSNLGHTSMSGQGGSITIESPIKLLGAVTEVLKMYMRPDV